MKSFVQRHQDQILGVLSGFGRLRFRGVLLIKKIPRTHRYLLTEAGVKAISAILAARQASLSQLAAA